MSAPTKKMGGFASKKKRSLKSIKLSTRAIYFLLSALTVLISSIIAFTQNPFPDPYQYRSLFSKEGFLYPVERNAFLRLPVITGVRDTFILPDGKHIWMVGDAGLILHSDDGGLNWQQQKISPPGEKTSGSNWHFIKSAYAAEPTTKMSKETESNLWQQFLNSKSPASNNNVEQENVTQDSMQQSDTDDEALWRQFMSEKNKAELQQQLEKTKATEVESVSVNKKESLTTKTAVEDIGATTEVKKEITNRNQEPEASGTKAAEIIDPSKVSLQAVYFINHEQGWAVGNQGVVISTHDGGESWQVQASGTTEYLTAVQMQADGLRGWTVGYRGTVITTRDGGESWQPQASETTKDLTAVQMQADGLRGWAVGYRGTVITTRDGGDSWQVQVSGTTENLSAVQMLGDGLRGWALGSSGSVITTRDGGASWQVQASGTRAWLSALQMQADGLRGWAVGSGGSVITTRDGGQSWQPQASGIRKSSYAFQIQADGQRGWMVGGYGVMNTYDGGLSWYPQLSHIGSDLVAIQMLDDNLRGWAVGENGRVITTRDGGQSWHQQVSGTLVTLLALQLQEDGLHGWAVGENGTVITTRDGGQSWDSQISGIDERLYSIQMNTDGQRGWVVGKNGKVLTTRDGGQTWQPQASGTRERLHSIQMQADGERGWAVGLDGTIITTGDGGENWQSLDSGTRSWLFAIQMQEDGQKGWAVGSDEVIATIDGGQSWQSQISGVGEWLYAIQIQADGQHGWIVGSDTTILSTQDGGETWENNLSPYERYPAPWYYISWLLAVGFLVPAFKQQRQKDQDKKLEPVNKGDEGSEASATKVAPVENILVSDRPLQYGENDVLGFKTIARGISKFIRNENTTPPLTLAITGAWGSGKSSLMNLLQTDLKKFGFRPVWFNAWHYQKEKHLLAALLTSIYKQGVPPWWCYDGLTFRARLLLRRGWRHWFPFVLLSGVVVALASYLYHQPGDFMANLNLLINSYADKGLSYAEIKSELGNILFDISLAEGSFIGGVFGLLITMFKGFKAFGISPVRLMSSMSGSFKPKELNQQLSFRHQFAQEFRDVTYALGNRPMVIMVDDLDRCQPESVLEVLEAVNFLVTSGDCYIVLGMVLKRVISCVGLGFKDLAEASDDGNEVSLSTTDNNNSEKENQSAFARNYLEKLINIEIPVPDTNDAQVVKLMSSNEKEIDEYEEKIHWPEKIYTGMQSLFSSLKEKRYKLLVLAVFTIVLVFSGWYGTQINVNNNLNTAENISQNTQSAPAVDNAVPVQPDTEIKPGQESEGKEKKVSDRSSEFKQGQQASAPLSFSLPPIITLLVAGLWLYLFKKPDPVEQDSQEFRDALGIWQPMIIHKKRTPRSIKRFMNQVRYFSMRHHSIFEKRQHGRIKQWLASKSKLFDFLVKEPHQNDFETYIPEDMLVALAAMHHGCPELMENRRIIDIKNDVLQSFKQEKDSQAEEATEGEKLLMKCIERHRSEFESYSLNDAQLKQFEKISKGIIVK